MIDPLGKLLTEIRDDEAVSDITTRIRGEEPAQGDAPPMVVITTFPIVRENRLPLARYQYIIRCYGSSLQQTAQLRGAVSDAIHHVGPRMSAAGVALYRSQVENEGMFQTDPDTQWPFQMVIVNAWVATVAVPAIS
jgi:hypothetical protein